MSIVNQKWVFGHGAGLDFSTAIPTPLTGLAINTFEGCASISDSNGNLLFYTDGVQVWDSAGTIRISGLHGNLSSTQSAAIVPVPGSPMEYFVITVDGPSGAWEHLNGIRLNASTWSWSALPAALLAPMGWTGATERLAIVPHANCRDYWALTVVHMIFMTTFARALRLFRVTPAGVQYVGDTPLPGITGSGVGYLRASPDGTRLALADSGSGTNAGAGSVTLCTFNNANGTISTSSAVTIAAPGPPTIPWGHPRNVYGVEFSPSGRYLYFSVAGAATGTAANRAGYVFQVEMTGVPTPQQVIQHANADGRYAVGALQLGPDGRIYVAKDGEAGVGAILNPDAPGASCNPDMSFVSFPGSPPAATCYMGLPSQLPRERLAAFSGDCGQVSDEVDVVLLESSGSKTNTLPPCVGDAVPCPCTSANPGGHHTCDAVAVPNVRPCISVRWGDSSSEHVETDDVEIMSITVCNCCSNATISGLTIGYLNVTDEHGGPVPTLPDGSPSVTVTPIGPICFGDIPPCTPEHLTCISREFTVITRGARDGRYRLELGSICYGVAFHFQEFECFALDLSRDR